MKIIAVLAFFTLLSTCNCSIIEKFFSGIWQKTKGK
jgi:hypothetical protein